MVVSQEDIRMVKDALGDRNAELIVELMGIQGYDPHKKIALCCNHSDTNPSMSYNPRTKSFHCFACGYNVDLIDAYMQGRNQTFIDACKSAFAEADIPFSTAEQGILRDNGYRYPNPEYADNKDIVYGYWKKRGISKEVIDYLGIQQDSRGNTMFEYRNLDDTLVMVKCRPSRKVEKGEAKCWFLKGTDTQHILYNMNKINPTQPLIITSGEGDCAAAIQSGFLNTVSISHGEKSLDFISECWDWLEQFETIVLVHDHDATGESFAKEVCRRLGESRVRNAEWNDVFVKDNGTKVFLKDLNELLYHCGEVAVREAINNAKEAQIESIVDFADVQDADMEGVSGFTTGITCLDRMLTKFYDGTLNLITGSASAGKSSLVSTFVCRNVDQDRPVFLYSGEMANSLESSWLRTAFAGQRGLDQFDGGLKKYYRVNPDVNKMITEKIKNKVFLYKDDKSHLYSDIMQSAESAIKRMGVKTIILDNMTSIDLGVVGDTKWDIMSRFVNELVSFAKRFDVCVILIVHPKKIDNRRVTLYQLAGVSNSVNLCHRCLSLYRIQDKDREPHGGAEYTQEQMGNYSVCIDILKDRFDSATGKSVGVYYDTSSRRFYDSIESLDYDYLHIYDRSTPLPYGSILYEMNEYENRMYGKVEAC